MPNEHFGTYNERFGTYTDALGKLVTVNRAHFASSVHDGRAAVGDLLPWAGTLLLAAMALTALGVRPRPAEFR